MIVERLLERRGEFLGYLRKQGVPEDQAEDVLQSALERGLEPWRSLPAPEAAVSWFYSVLRNALVDRARRVSAAGRALDRYAQEVDELDEPVESRRVCGCTRGVLQSLRARLEAQCGKCATGGGRCSDCYCQPASAL